MLSTWPSEVTRVWQESIARAATPGDLRADVVAVPRVPLRDMDIPNVRAYNRAQLQPGPQSSWVDEVLTGHSGVTSATRGDPRRLRARMSF